MVFFLKNWFILENDRETSHFKWRLVNRGKETLVLKFPCKVSEQEPIMDEGKYHFIKVFQLLNEKEVIKLEYHHFIFLNKWALCWGIMFQWLLTVFSWGNNWISMIPSLAKGYEPGSDEVSRSSHQFAGNAEKGGRCWTAPWVCNQQNPAWEILQWNSPGCKR